MNLEKLINEKEDLENELKSMKVKPIVYFFNGEYGLGLLKNKIQEIQKYLNEVPACFYDRLIRIYERKEKKLVNEYQDRLFGDQFGISAIDKELKQVQNFIKKIKEISKKKKGYFRKSVEL